jgi:hypothetical protein
MDASGGRVVNSERWIGPDQLPARPSRLRHYLAILRHYLRHYVGDTV